MGNPLMHFDFVGDDPEALVDFYEELFDWKIEKMAGPMPYWTIDTGQPPVGGIMGKSQPEHMQCIYFEVESVDEHAAQAQELGGTVVVPKTAVAEMGWFAVMVDPQGNAFSVWEWAEGQKPPG